MFAPLVVEKQILRRHWRWSLLAIYLEEWQYRHYRIADYGFEMLMAQLCFLISGFNQNLKSFNF
jgi:hypothetical protein